MYALADFGYIHLMQVENLAESLNRITLNDGRKITLIGTAHISSGSVELVEKTIEEENPDRICIELDESRMKSKSEKQSWENMDIRKVFKEGRGFFLLANTALASFQKRMGEQTGIKPGEEILTAAKIAKEKNIDEILIYLSHIRNVNFVLFIVGDGPYRKNLEDLTKKLNLCGKVVFFGQADPNDVSSYYHACDVFLSSSKSETQGLCYAEALSSHIPIIARKDDAIRGVVIDGANGFQYENEDEFRKSVMFFYEDRSQIEAFGKRAFESSSMFSIDAFSYRVEKAYLDAIGKVLP